MDLKKELQILEELIKEVENGNDSKEMLDKIKQLREEVINHGKQELKLMREEVKKVKDEQIQKINIEKEQSDLSAPEAKERIEKLNNDVERVDQILKKHELAMAKEFAKCGITQEELESEEFQENTTETLKEEDINTQEESKEAKKDDDMLEELKSIEEYGIGKTIEQIEKMEKELEELGNKGEKTEPISVEELEKTIQHNREYYDNLYKEKKKENIISRIWNKIKNVLGLKKENKTLTSGIVENEESSWKDSIKEPIEQLNAEDLQKNARKQLENQVGIGSIATIDDTIECYDIQKDISIGKADIKGKEFKIDFIAAFDKEGNMEHCLNNGNIGILTQDKISEALIKVHLLPLEEEEEKDDIEYEYDQREEDDDDGVWVLWNDVKDKFVDYVIKQKQTELGNI